MIFRFFIEGTVTCEKYVTFIKNILGPLLKEGLYVKIRGTNMRDVQPIMHWAHDTNVTEDLEIFRLDVKGLSNGQLAYQISLY